MAANSLLSCKSSSCLGLKLLPPAHSSLVSRRSLFTRPIMTADIISPSSTTIQLDGTRSTLSAGSGTAPREQQEIKSISSGERSLALEMNTGLNLQLSSLSNAPTWAKLVLGSVVLLSIPLLRRLRGIKDVVKVVDDLADVVEATAEATAKASKEIADALPDGRLKEEALKLEKIASLIDKDAEATESIIDSVDKAVEELESELKPIIERIKAKKNDAEGNVKTKTVEDQSKESNNEKHA